MKFISRYKVWQALTGLLLLLFSCGEDRSGKPVIAVSFDSQKELVERITGDDYEVVALLPPGSDPELFDPDMRTMKALERAEIYLTTSTLGFETQVGERIKANYPDLKVVDLTEGIDILMHTHGVAAASSHASAVDHADNQHDDHHDSHGHGHEAHPVGDPHLLSSIANARQVASNINKAVKELNQSRNRIYQARFEALDEELSRRQVRTDSLLKSASKIGATFVVMHPSLSYYARDYSMTQIPLEVDGKEATPRQLEERLEMAAAAGPEVLFYEEGHSETQAKELARSLGIEAYPVRLNGTDFLDRIDDVTRNLTRQKSNSNHE